VLTGFFLTVMTPSWVREEVLPVLKRDEIDVSDPVRIAMQQGYYVSIAGTIISLLHSQIIILRHF